MIIATTAGVPTAMAFFEWWPGPTIVAMLVTFILVMAALFIWPRQRSGGRAWLRRVAKTEDHKVSR